MVNIFFKTMLYTSSLVCGLGVIGFIGFTVMLPILQLTTN